MSNKTIKPADNSANMQNPNKGFPGQNQQRAQNQGNRGKQLNPNQKKVSLSKILCLLFLSVFISLSVSCKNNIDDEPKPAPAIEIKLPSETTSATIGEIAEISVSFINFSVAPETVDIFVEEVDTPIKEAASVKDGKISIDTTGFEAGTYKLYVKSGTVKSNSLSVVLVKSVSLITISSETTSATIGKIAEISVSFSNFSVAPEKVDIFVEGVDTPIKEAASVKDGKISIDTTGFEAGTYKLYVKSGTVKSNSLSVVLVENNLLPVPEGVTAPAAEEQTEFTVTLDSFDAAKKIPVIKVIREITGLGLGEAKALVEGAPKTVKEGVSKADADAMVAKITEAGGKASKK